MTANWKEHPTSSSGGRANKIQVTKYVPIVIGTNIFEIATGVYLEFDI
jgi:hypothetical protein